MKLGLVFDSSSLTMLNNVGLFWHTLKYMWASAKQLTKYNWISEKAIAKVEILQSLKWIKVYHLSETLYIIA